MGTASLGATSSEGHASCSPGTELPTRGRMAATEALPASEKDGNRMGRSDATNEFGARVRTAHGDGWQVEGWARQVHGGGAQVVRGARLMASGLPTPIWNNADIEALDVDLEAIAAWYLARDVPWGVRLPSEWDLAIGQPLFTKRCQSTSDADSITNTPRLGLV
jgi:hypothetical protein